MLLLASPKENTESILLPVEILADEKAIQKSDELIKQWKEQGETLKKSAKVVELQDEYNKLSEGVNADKVISLGCHGVRG